MSRGAAVLPTTILLANAIPVESQGTSGINQLTRQILGYRERQASSESSFILAATVQ